MKVLLVNKFHYRKGGSETYYFTLAKALKEAGHEVVFFAMKNEKNIPCEQEKYFIDNVEYNGKINPFKQLGLAKKTIYSKEAKDKITKLIENEKPDLAIFNLVHRQITLSIIEPLKANNIPIFWVTHDLIFACPNYTMLDNDGNICEKCLNHNFKNCFKNKCIKGSIAKSYLAYREAKYIKKHNYYNDIDLYICPSKFYKYKLTEAHFTTSPIIHLSNPLEMDINKKISSIDEIENYVLYFGRLSKEKGVKTLIDAVVDVEGRELFILGTGPIEKELKHYVFTKNVGDRIKFLGYKTGKELNEFIRKSKVVVLPSEWYENGPYSAIEAMNLGKPLIVSNIGGLPELVEAGKNGYIFETGDIKSLKKCISKIFELSNESYNALSLNSMKLCKQKFGVKNYCEMIIDRYRKV